MFDLMHYLPELYRDIKEVIELTDAERAELDVLERSVDQVLESYFVTTAQEWAIRRREDMLDIHADPASETLDFRRNRLINRYSTRVPFTVRYLQQHLDNLVGGGVAQVDIDIHNHVLQITLTIPDAAYFKEIAYTIQVIKPANLVYKQATSLSGTIALEEHIWKTSLARQAKLGTWKLGRIPFAKRGEEVQLK